MNFERFPDPNLAFNDLDDRKANKPLFVPSLPGTAIHGALLFNEGDERTYLGYRNKWMRLTGADGGVGPIGPQGPIGPRGLQGIPGPGADLTNYRTADQITAQIAAAVFSGAYGDLTGAPDLSIYALASAIFSGNYSDLVGAPDLSVYALVSQLFSGDYNDLIHTPTIPTLRTPLQTARALETLSGDERLSANAVKDLPTGGSGGGVASTNVGTFTVGYDTTVNEFVDTGLNLPDAADWLIIQDYKANGRWYGRTQFTDLPASAIGDTATNDNSITITETITGVTILGYRLGRSAANRLLLANVYNTTSLTDASVNVRSVIEADDVATLGFEDIVNALAGQTGIIPYSVLSGVPMIRTPQEITAEIAAAVFSGAYGDLTGAPDLSIYALASSVFSGNYNDLINAPTLFSGAYADLTGKPALFSGDYNDLINAPTVPTLRNAAQTSALLQTLTGNDRLPASAISGLPEGVALRTAQETYNLIQSLLDYNDLSNTPTIPTLRNAADTYSLIQSLLNYDDLSNRPTPFSGSYNDLTDRPTIPTLRNAAQTYALIQGLLNYNDLINTPTIPTLRNAAQTYALIQGLLDYSDVSGTPDLSVYRTGTQITAEIAARYTNTEKAKLGGIENNATRDQSNTEIRDAYEANANRNPFTDAAESKLDALPEAGDSLGNRGQLIATSGALSAGDDYGQLADGFTLGSNLPSGIELSNMVLKLPNIPPSGYFGLWASLEISGAEVDRTLLNWGNVQRKPNPTLIGNRYLLITTDGPDRVNTYDDGTYNADRSFALNSETAQPRGITFDDDNDLIWIYDTQDNTVEAYTRVGVYQSARDIPVGTFEGDAITYYNGRMIIASLQFGFIQYRNVTTGAQIGTNLSVGQSDGMTVFNGYLYLGRVSNINYRTIGDDFTLGSASTVNVSAAGVGSIRGLSSDGTHLYVVDSGDNGYYRFTVGANGAPDVDSAVFTSTAAQTGTEQGLAFAVDPAATPTDRFNLDEDADTFYRLHNGSNFVDVHYLRQPDGDVRLALASDTDLLPSNAVVKLYAASITV